VTLDAPPQTWRACKSTQLSQFLCHSARSCKSVVRRCLYVPRALVTCLRTDHQVENLRTFLFQVSKAIVTTQTRRLRAFWPFERLWRAFKRRPRAMEGNQPANRPPPKAFALVYDVFPDLSENDITAAWESLDKANRTAESVIDRLLDGTL
jgi:hypothetical protein